MNRVRLCLLFLGVVTGFSNSVIAADDTGVKNRVNFQVESGRDVRNDLMVVVMKVLVEDRKPEQVAEQINRTMSWAMEQVKPEQAVKAESGNYRTWPVYEDKKLVRWRGQQELWLESGDTARLGALLAVLQSRLQVQSMQFQVSPQNRESVVNELITDALQAFRQRAGIISRSLGANDYQIDDVTINSRGQPPVVPVRMHAAAMAESAGSSQPALERGTSRVTVQVSGSVRLQFREPLVD
jgi:predicted secreted protein